MPQVPETNTYETINYNMFKYGFNNPNPLSGGITADQVNYDNSASSLVSTDLQNVVDELSFRDFIIVPTIGLTRYLSPTGDDSNDGETPGTAWKTLTRAGEEVNKSSFQSTFNQTAYTFILDDGTYDDAVGDIVFLIGVGGKILIQGNNGSPTSVIINAPFFVTGVGPDCSFFELYDCQLNFENVITCCNFLLENCVKTSSTTGNWVTTIGTNGVLNNWTIDNVGFEITPFLFFSSDIRFTGSWTNTGTFIISLRLLTLSKRTFFTSEATYSTPLTGSILLEDYSKYRTLGGSNHPSGTIDADSTTFIEDISQVVRGTFADESAAGTGGLVTGEIYQTATGELRVKL